MQECTGRNVTAATATSTHPYIILLYIYSKHMLVNGNNVKSSVLHVFILYTMLYSIFKYIFVHMSDLISCAH
jgi:hypothetical protein